MRAFIWVPLLGLLGALVAAEEDALGVLADPKLSIVIPEQRQQQAGSDVGQEPASHKTSAAGGAGGGGGGGILHTVKDIIQSFSPNPSPPVVSPEAEVPNEKLASQPSSVLPPGAAAVGEGDRDDGQAAGVKPVPPQPPTNFNANPNPSTNLGSPQTEEESAVNTTPSGTNRDKKLVQRYNDVADTVLNLLSRSLTDLERLPINIEDDVALRALEEGEPPQPEPEPESNDDKGTQSDDGDSSGNNNNNKRKRKNKNNKNRNKNRRQNNRRDEEDSEMEESERNANKKNKKNKNTAVQEEEETNAEEVMEGEEEVQVRPGKGNRKKKNKNKNKNKNKKNKNKKNRRKNRRKNKKNKKNKSAVENSRDGRRLSDEDLEVEGRRKPDPERKRNNRKGNRKNKNKNKKNRRNQQGSEGKAESRQDLGPVYPSPEERQLSNAYITGLTSLSRDGDVVVDASSNPVLVDVRAKVGPLLINLADSARALTKSKVSTTLEANLKFRVKNKGRGRQIIKLADLTMSDPNEVSVTRFDLPLEPEVVSAAQQTVHDALDVQRLGRIFRNKLEGIFEEENVVQNLEHHSLLQEQEQEQDE